MQIEGKVYIGIDGEPYIHIYRKGYWPTSSIRLSLHDDGDIVASRTSKKVWRDWAKEADEKKALA